MCLFFLLVVRSFKLLINVSFQAEFLDWIWGNKYVSMACGSVWSALLTCSVFYSTYECFLALKNMLMRTCTKPKDSYIHENICTHGSSYPR